MVSAGTEKARSKAREDLDALRRNQPKRHPLWAFFHDKTQAEVEEDVQYRLQRRSKVGTASEAEESTEPGAYSLAYSLQKPDTAAGKSG